MRKSLYRTKAHNRGGTAGTTAVSDGLSVRTAQPGDSDGGTNPEQLLAMSWATCLGATVRSVLRNAELEAAESFVDVEVEMFEEDSGEFSFEPSAHVCISGIPEATAVEIAHRAHARCPVSKLLVKSRVVVDIAGVLHTIAPAQS